MPFLYDAAGRLGEDRCLAYRYDVFDRRSGVEPRTGSGGLPACSLLEAASSTYAFDALDRERRRPEQDPAGIDVYDGLGAALVANVKGSVYALDPAGSPIGLRNGVVEQLLADDGHGNVAAITSTLGPVICTARFDPFGNPMGLEGTEATCDFGTSPHSQLFYRGGRRDQATGVYQFGSRVYDPAKAAWLTPDQYRAHGQEHDLSVGVDPLTRNTYTYVNGDPVNYWDPDGHKLVRDETGGGRNHCPAQASFVRPTDGCEDPFARQAPPNLTRTLVSLAAGVGAGIGVAVVCTSGIGCVIAAGVAAGALSASIDCPPGQRRPGCALEGSLLGGATAGVTSRIAGPIRSLIRRAGRKATPPITRPGAAHTPATARIPSSNTTPQAPRAISAFDDLAHSSHGIRSFSAQQAVTRGHGGQIQAHHLIERRFANVMGGSTDDWASIIVTRAEHQQLTNVWRQAIPYGAGTRTATRAQVEAAARQVYADYPEILRALGLG